MGLKFSLQKCDINKAVRNVIRREGIFFRAIINFLETSQSTLPTSLNLILSKILLCKVDGYFYNSKI